jgi:hypothetical protein
VRESCRRQRYRQQWLKRLAKLVVSGKWVNYGASSLGFEPRPQARALTLTDVSVQRYTESPHCPTSVSLAKQRVLQRLAQLVVSGDWKSYRVSTPRVRKKKSRRGRNSQDRATDLWLKETLALTAPEATPADWRQLTEATPKPQVRQRSRRKCRRKKGFYRGQD